MPQDEWPTFQAQRDIIISDFDKSTPYGDRRQVRSVPANHYARQPDCSKARAFRAHT